jgi:2-polyprenyl-3-methyl-5-hydroxy-6-metoxy-1,4-benzoquinol methylase
VQFTTELASQVAERGVLDVGCSHGRGVQVLWEHGVKAAGVDLSSTAVEMARSARMGRPGVQCAVAEESCFQSAPATQLPFPDAAFDAIMSTDVLEHLLLHEVRPMAAEVHPTADRTQKNS